MARGLSEEEKARHLVELQAIAEGQGGRASLMYIGTPGPRFSGDAPRGTSGVPYRITSVTFHGVRFAPWQDEVGRDGRTLGGFE